MLSIILGNFSFELIESHEAVKLYYFQFINEKTESKRGEETYSNSTASKHLNSVGSRAHAATKTTYAAEYMFVSSLFIQLEKILSTSSILSKGKIR